MNKNCKKANYRKLDSSANSAWRPWADLEFDMLFLISMQLNIVDYQSFGSVCKSWKLVSLKYKKNFVASRQPLIFIQKTNARRSCSFFNIPDFKRFKTMLPNLTGMSSVGSSCGYLVMLGTDRKFWLVNPCTRHELRFPILPHFFQTYDIRGFRVILLYQTKLSDFVLAVVFRTKKYLLFSHSGAFNWASYSYEDEPWEIVDISVCKGKIYALTNNAMIGELKLSHHPVLNLFYVRSTPPLFCQYLQLVGSPERLFMVDGCWMHFVIYEIDWIRMKWLKKENLGEESLFLSDMKCSALVKPTKWGGVSNCVYFLDRINNNAFFILYLDGQLNRRYKINTDRHASGRSNIWYFPEQCNFKDYLIESPSAPSGIPSAGDRHNMNKDGLVEIVEDGRIFFDSRTCKLYVGNQSLEADSSFYSLRYRDLCSRERFLSRFSYRAKLEIQQECSPCNLATSSSASNFAW